MRVSTLVMILSWISIFAMGWLLLFGILPSNNLSWTFFVFFCVVALLTAAGQTDNPKKE